VATADLVNAVAAGYDLADDAQLLWSSFEELLNRSGLPGAREIPMESSARAVEIMLKRSWDGDSTGQRPDAAVWDTALRDCGYVHARLAIRKEAAPDTSKARRAA
jgi:hypothetical protein